MIGMLLGDEVGLGYGLAVLDRFTGTIDWSIELPMEGVISGQLNDFFRSADT